MKDEDDLEIIKDMNPYKYYTFKGFAESTEMWNITKYEKYTRNDPGL